MQACTIIYLDLTHAHNVRKKCHIIELISNVFSFGTVFTLFIGETFKKRLEIETHRKIISGSDSYFFLIVGFIRLDLQEMELELSICSGGVGGVGGWGGAAGDGATPPQAGAAGTWSSQPRDRQGT